MEGLKTLTADTVLSLTGERHSSRVITANLGHQQIAKLCTFKNFSKLKVLNLSFNQLEEPPQEDFISHNKELKELRLSGNRLTSLQGLKSPTLEVLYLDYNLVSSLEGIQNFRVSSRQRLTLLRLDSNNLSTIEGVERLTDLRVLSLNNNQLIQLVNLRMASNLTELHVSSNRLTSILEGSLPNSLKQLHAADNRLMSIAFLKDCPRLEVKASQQLNLSQNNLSTIEGLPKLEFLQDLLLSRNQMCMIGTDEDFSDLCPTLVSLDLSDNVFHSRMEFIGLSNIKSLYELNLKGNPCSQVVKWGLYSFVEEVQSELPQIAILNDFRLKRLTGLQNQLEEYEKSLGPLPEERPDTGKPGTSRPGTARPGTAKNAEPLKPKVSVMEEGLVRNIIDGMQKDLNERRKEFKAVISRLRTETQKIFALPGELYRFESFKSSTFTPLKIVPEADEFDESRDDLYRTLELEEEQWFRDQQKESRTANHRIKYGWTLSRCPLKDF